MYTRHDRETVIQVPQFILEDAIASGSGASTNIICTQPRRLPAVALANRVAEEMCQQCGGLVGYSIRLEKKSSKDTRLLFCTTGVLWMLQWDVASTNLQVQSIAVPDCAALNSRSACCKTVLCM